MDDKPRIIVFDAVPDGEFWLIDPVLYARLMREYDLSHDLAIDEGAQSGDVVVYTARMVRNNVEVDKGDD